MAVLRLVAVLVAVVGYVLLCLLLLVYVAAPLSVLALVVGGLGGSGTALLLTGLTLAGRRPQVRTIGPDDVVAGAIGGQQRPGLPRRDRAWPTYFAAQVRYDLSAANGWTTELVVRCWRVAVRRTASGVKASSGVLAACWPLFVPVLVLLLAITAGGLVGIALVTAVFVLATAMAWAAGLLVVAALRGADRTHQRVFRAVASCPTPGCYQVSTLPAYQCPNAGCRELHRDLRPGRLGVLWRRCGCGTTMPTTVLRSTSLQAVCPGCTKPLHPGAAAVTDVRLPVFGATMAGKTRLIMAGLVSLAGLSSADGITVAAADPVSKRALAGYAETIARQLPTPKTDRSLPAAVTVQLKVRQRTALVHVFDAAGELFVDREQNAHLAYLDQARALVFVLDPFCIPEVRARLTGATTDVFHAAASHDPEDSYHVTVQRLRSYGVDTRHQRLAFVVSKADLLLGLPMADGLVASSISVRSWLAGVGLDNLLLAADRDFAEVRFFLVSAMTAEAQPPTSALAPLRWVLAGDRIHLGAAQDT